jgi:hypothetical protein
MKRFITLLAALAAGLTAVPNGAYSENGQVAAGVLGGLAVGTLLGSAVAPRPYYAPAPVYVAPPVVYEAPSCYWTRSAPVWDEWRGIWIRQRVQVCD